MHLSVKKNYGALKEIIIACHHMPTCWVVCDFSHVYSLWILWQGVQQSHALVFHMPKPVLALDQFLITSHIIYIAARAIEYCHPPNCLGEREYVTTEKILFKKMLNNKGQRMEPCGTPVRIVSHLLKLLFTLSLCLSFFRYLEIVVFWSLLILLMLKVVYSMNNCFNMDSFSIFTENFK